MTPYYSYVVETGQKNDCVLQSAFKAATCLGIELDKTKAIKLFEQYRTSKRGGMMTNVIPNFLVYVFGTGYTISTVKATGKTLEQCRQLTINRKNVYIVCNNRHAMALCEGVVYDNLSRPMKKSRIRYAWEIIPFKGGIV